MYALLRKILFKLKPETAHYVALQSLQWAAKCRLLSPKKIGKPITLMGLIFPNKIGIAAGLDKNGDYIEGLASTGVGFVEIGTVTPKAQFGNPKPRVFRLVEDQAIINRMGFNSKGADYVAEQLAHRSYQGILGINLGKNRDTPLELALNDYIYGIHALWQYASYFAINISSPNTPGLRDLHHKESLHLLCAALKKEQLIIWQRESKYIPMLVKISPDLTDEALKDFATVAIAEKMDGVIATNTTVSRDNLKDAQQNEVGGLSGKPLQALSTKMIRDLRVLMPDMPIIAVGGIMDAKSAAEKLAAGANLLQIYTGFIYKGPKLIDQIAKL